MAPVEHLWTTADDEALRAALAATLAEADAARLAGPAAVRAAGELRRRDHRRRSAALVAAAVAVLVAAAGLGHALLTGSDRRTSPPAATPTRASALPTVLTSPAPRRTPSPTPTPASTSTDVVGEDGSLGPFHVGMTRAEVRATIRQDFPDGSVRLDRQTFGGGFDVEVLVQDGADTGIPGPTRSTGVIGIFDAENRHRKGVLDALVAPSTARLGGVRVGSPVSAFEQAFPDRVAPNESSSLYLLTLSNGVQLQLGRPSAYLDPSAGVDPLLILPKGAPTFSDFPFFAS